MHCQDVNNESVTVVGIAALIKKDRMESSRALGRGIEAETIDLTPLALLNE